MNFRIRKLRVANEKERERGGGMMVKWRGLVERIKVKLRCVWWSRRKIERERERERQ
jgi:hypothetical protein